jgi:hypothetical protein
MANGAPIVLQILRGVILSDVEGLRIRCFGFYHFSIFPSLTFHTSEAKRPMK